MKALTLHQPWASLIACGAKTIETRSWPTKHRGPLAIHAAKRRADPAVMKELVAGHAWEAWYAAGLVSADGSTDDMPLGAVVAVAELADVFYIDRTVQSSHPELVALAELTGFPVDHKPVPSEQLPFGDYSPGRWAWMLKDVFPIDPAPARGLQGLWTWRPGK